MMMKMNRKLLGAVALFAMFSAFEANAQQNLNVSATVPDVCVITTPGTDLNMLIDLSNMDTLPGPFTGTASFLWRCSLGNAATINIDSGGGTGATGATRFMIGPGGVGVDELAYTLTTPAAALWGNTANGQPGLAVVGAGMGAGDEQTTVITGTVLLADAESSTAGAYNDTVIITLLP